MEEDKTITLKGEAKRSKAGLVVDGMIIIDNAFAEKNVDMDKYIGKVVEVTGTIDESPFPTRTKEGLPQQGFEGECITHIKSIKIVEE